MLLQEVVALTAVAVAAGWLTRNYLRRRREEQGCDSCALMKVARESAKRSAAIPESPAR